MIRAAAERVAASPWDRLAQNALESRLRDHRSLLSRMGELVLELARTGSLEQLASPASEADVNASRAVPAEGPEEDLPRRSRFAHVAAAPVTRTEIPWTEALTQMAQAHERTAISSPATPLPDHLERLAQERAQLPPAPWSLQTPDEIAAEINALFAVTADERLLAWAELPQHLHRLVLSWVTSRARAAQAAVDLTGKDTHPDFERLERVFPRLTNHSKRTKPGTVIGLAYTHRPKSDDWLADARNYESDIDRLVQSWRMRNSTEG